MTDTNTEWLPTELEALDREARIDLGIHLLDEKIPEWRDYVSAEKLDMGSPRWDVPGQIGRHRFGIVERWKAMNHTLTVLGLDTDPEATAHGFMESDYEMAEELTAAWQERLAPGITPTDPGQDEDEVPGEDLVDDNDDTN